METCDREFQIRLNVVSLFISRHPLSTVISRIDRYLSTLRRLTSNVNRLFVQNIQLEEPNSYFFVLTKLKYFCDADQCHYRRLFTVFEADKAVIGSELLPAPDVTLQI
jgi:hypothetical protein